MLSARAAARVHPQHCHPPLAKRPPCHRDSFAVTSAAFAPRSIRWRRCASRRITPTPSRVTMSRWKVFWRADRRSRLHRVPCPPTNNNREPPLAIPSMCKSSIRVLCCQLVALFRPASIKMGRNTLGHYPNSAGRPLRFVDVQDEHPHQF